MVRIIIPVVQAATIKDVLPIPLLPTPVPQLTAVIAVPQGAAIQAEVHPRPQPILLRQEVPVLLIPAAVAVDHSPVVVVAVAVAAELVGGGGGGAAGGGGDAGDNDKEVTIGNLKI